MQLWAWKSIQAIRFSCGKDFDSMTDVNYFFCGHISFRTRLKIGRCASCFLKQKFIGNIIFNYLEKLHVLSMWLWKVSLLPWIYSKKEQSERKQSKFPGSPKDIFQYFVLSTLFSCFKLREKLSKKRWEAAALISRNSICDYLFLFSPEDRPRESKIEATQNQDDVCKGQSAILLCPPFLRKYFHI